MPMSERFSDTSIAHSVIVAAWSGSDGHSENCRSRCAMASLVPSSLVFPGALVGLSIGLWTYVPTAWAAVFEVGIQRPFWERCSVW